MGNNYCCKQQSNFEQEQIVSYNQPIKTNKAKSLGTVHITSTNFPPSNGKDNTISEEEEIKKNSPEIPGNYDVKQIYKENDFILQDGDGYFSAEDLKYYNSLQRNDVNIQMRSGNRQKPNIKKIRWREGKTIGSGSFGHVIQGMNTETGELMAVKQIPINESQWKENQELVEAIELEIEILRNLSHKNIVRYITTSKSEDTLNIFLEFVAGGSISTLIKKYGILKESLIKRYTKQILEGLEYLHSHKVIHRDIKGPNILVDEKGLCKLADFGSSKKIAAGASENEKFKQLKGTANYMPPEVIRGGDEAQKSGRFSDIWSVGCTLIEMSSGLPPWSQYDNPLTRMWKIAQANEPIFIPEQLSPEAKDFIRQCLRIVPQERPNVRMLLQHPFITGKPISRVPRPILSTIEEQTENGSIRNSGGNFPLKKVSLNGRLESSNDFDEKLSPYFGKQNVNCSQFQLNESPLNGKVFFTEQAKDGQAVCESPNSISQQQQLSGNKQSSIGDAMNSEDNIKEKSKSSSQKSCHLDSMSFNPYQKHTQSDQIINDDQIKQYSFQSNKVLEKGEFTDEQNQKYSPLQNK